MLNNVDDNIFFPTSKRKKRLSLWGISATNWKRNEKRPEELLKFANFIGIYNEKILLIGKSNIKHPNIINVGYIENKKELSKTISSVDAWVNFSYRDAAPKAVLQSIKCNKPVLYADSGGLTELVKNFGVPIKDNKKLNFDNNNFNLKDKEIKKSYFLFKEKYNRSVFQKPKQKKYIDTLREYANIFIKTKNHVFQN